MNICNYHLGIATLNTSFPCALTLVAYESWQCNILRFFTPSWQWFFPQTAYTPWYIDTFIHSANLSARSHTHQIHSWSGIIPSRFLNFPTQAKIPWLVPSCRVLGCSWGKPDASPWTGWVRSHNWAHPNKKHPSSREDTNMIYDSHRSNRYV